MLAINKSLIFISNLLKSFELKGGGLSKNVQTGEGGTLYYGVIVFSMNDQEMKMIVKR